MWTQRMFLTIFIKKNPTDRELHHKTIKSTPKEKQKLLIVYHNSGMGSVSVCSINCHPDDLLVHILSFLPTKQAALTSLLSKRWRTLFAFTHNLDFDNSIFLHPKKIKSYLDRKDIQKRFNDFVERTLALQDGNEINKFSLKLFLASKDGPEVDRWICNALEHGVSELHLHISMLFWKFPIPSKVFTSTTLVKLSLGTSRVRLDCPSFPLDTSLPALKVLFIDSICIVGNQLSDVLLAACPALEDLTIQYYNYYPGFSYVISSKTIKKLSVTYECGYNVDFSRNISFDTPNVVDFYYSDYLGHESPQCHLDSLGKATLDLHFLKDKRPQAQNGADVTDLISGIGNVKALHLTISDVEVIPVCCKGGLPMFNNLVDLVFSSIKEGWRLLLPRLLQHSPNLKNLVLSGLDCFPYKRHRFIQIPPNNQIKMLRIMQYQGSAHELKHLRHFLLNMECLEVVQVYVAAAIDDPKQMQIKEDLLKLPTASSNLKIQVI